LAILLGVLGGLAVTSGYAAPETRLSGAPRLVLLGHLLTADPDRDLRLG